MRISCGVKLFVLLPLAVILALAPGCGQGAVSKKGKRGSSGSSGAVEDQVEVARKPLAATGHGKITGKVVYDGDPPALALQDFGAAHLACCTPKLAEFDSDKYKQDWIVDKATKGVQNAVVILQPPPGKYFEIPADQQKADKPLEIDQKYCAFRPHVFVHFPSFYDQATNDQKPTGQKFIVKNSAGCDHNYKIIPNSDENRAGGKTLGAGQESTLPAFRPQTKPITIKCDIHTWMTAYGFILEHPYAAVSNEKGEFLIENAPLGVDLQVVGWHEMAGYFHGGQEGTKMKLEPNMVLGPFKIKGR